MAASEIYEFGAFMLEPSERRLSNGGADVALPPKAFDVLVALVENAGRLVSKRELLARVWPECFVEEGIVAVHISALRKALEDPGRHCIETVPRAGYRFAAPVTRRAATSHATTSHTSRPEVHEMIGRGRSHLLRASMLEIPQAIAAFQAAVDLDDTYAAAHAGLALALCAQAEFRVAPPAASYPAAKAAALRALALDPTCADAQVALAAVLFFGEWDWTGARRSVERALESAPHHTEALLLYGRILEASGKLQPGLQMKLRALERDPFSASVHLQISISYWNQRNYNEAVQWADRALALDPHHPHAREHLAAAYLKKGDFERHLAENIKHAETHGIPAAALEPLVQAYKTGGRPQALRYILEHFSKAPDGGPAILMAVHYGEAGDVDAAFQHLERAIDSRDPALVHLAIAPQWDSLRADPRFEDCLARMGLGPSRAATLKSSCG